MVSSSSSRYFCLASNPNVISLVSIIRSCSIAANADPTSLCVDAVEMFGKPSSSRTKCSISCAILTASDGDGGTDRRQIYFGPLPILTQANGVPLGIDGSCDHFIWCFTFWRWDRKYAAKEADSFKTSLRTHSSSYVLHGGANCLGTFFFSRQHFLCLIPLPQWHGSFLPISAIFDSF